MRFIKKSFIAIFILSAIVITGCSSAQKTSTQPSSTSSSSTSDTQAETKPAVTPMVKLTDIAEKSETEVAAILGQPKSSKPGKWKYAGTNETTTNCVANTYNNGIEVRFIDGKAALINITPASPLDFSNLDKALQLIGLKPVTPNSTLSSGAAWKNIEGIYSLYIMNNDGKITFMKAIVSEKYK